MTYPDIFIIKHRYRWWIDDWIGGAKTRGWEERIEAINKLGGKPEITRFKGLGEISPDEFKFFIGEDIRLDPVMLDRAVTSEELLSFYMGKNTQERQKFIIENLKIELDPVINDWRRRG